MNLKYSLNFGMKDTGKRVALPTGSMVEDKAGKGRYDLISTVMLRRLAVVMERGARKYSERNWERGQKLARYLNSALRHTLQALEGLEDEDHAVQAIANLMMFVHTKEMVERGALPRELDDLPRVGAPQEGPFCQGDYDKLEALQHGGHI